MAIQTIVQLKQWFETGDYPTQQQFWDWLDSYRHKSDSIAMSDIADLITTLQNKADLVAGKVPAGQLPSYVDDVLEYNGVGNFPGVGETGKIYIDTSMVPALAYRWSGSVYIQVGGGVSDDLKLNISDVYNALDRTTAGKALDARQGKVLKDLVDTNTTDIATNAAAIVTEAAARAAADTTLQTNITAEATTRASADTTLQTNITAEATARATDITAEATARAAADALRYTKTEVDAIVAGYLTTAAAATTYFPLLGGTLTGTGGAGFIGLPSQSSAPGTPASGVRIYANGSNLLSIKRVSGFAWSLDGSAISADRTYTWQDASGTVPLLGSTQTFTGVNTFTVGLTIADSQNLSLSNGNYLRAVNASSVMQFYVQSVLALLCKVNGSIETSYITTTGGTSAIQHSSDNAADVGALFSKYRTGYFGTSAFAPIIVGGNANGASLKLRPTSGTGISGSDIIFQVGVNGATEVARIFNGGNTSFGSATDSGEKLQVTGAMKVTSILNAGRLIIAGAADDGTSTLIVNGTLKAGGIIQTPLIAGSGALNQLTSPNSATGWKISAGAALAYIRLYGGTETISSQVSVCADNGFRISNSASDLANSVNSIFTVSSSTKGAIPYSRMTQVQRLAISMTASDDLMLVGQTDGTKGLYIYKDGTGWIQVI